MARGIGRVVNGNTSAYKTKSWKKTHDKDMANKCYKCDLQLAFF